VKKHYGALRSRDLKTWEEVTAQMSFPDEGTPVRMRHGTAIAVAGGDRGQAARRGCAGGRDAGNWPMRPDPVLRRALAWQERRHAAIAARNRPDKSAPTAGDEPPYL